MPIVPFNLYSYQTGLTLEAQPFDALHNALGSAITAGFVEIGGGSYQWTVQILPAGTQTVELFNAIGPTYVGVTFSSSEVGQQCPPPCDPCDKPHDPAHEIAVNAAGPKSASNDSGSMSQHSLPDQIAAANWLAAREALRKSATGIRYVRVRPGNNSDVDVHGGNY